MIGLLGFFLVVACVIVAFSLINIALVKKEMDATERQYRLISDQIVKKSG